MPRLDQDIFDRYMARVASDYSQYSSGKIDKTQRDQLDYDAEQAALNEQMYRDIGDFFSTLGDSIGLAFTHSWLGSELVDLLGSGKDPKKGGATSE